MIKLETYNTKPVWISIWFDFKMLIIPNQISEGVRDQTNSLILIPFQNQVADKIREQMYDKVENV